jgi:hypothetical protein
VESLGFNGIKEEEMQTIYEAEDINLENELHKTVYEALQVQYLLSLILPPVTATTAKEDMEDKMKEYLTRSTATFINSLTKKGFTLVKSEVPEVYMGS